MGVEARLTDVTGVLGRALAALNADGVWTRVLEIEEGTLLLNRCVGGRFKLDLGAGVFLACSACFSFARRKVSAVLPDNVAVYGVVSAIVLEDDGDGVLVPTNSAVVPKFGRLSSLPLSREFTDRVFLVAATRGDEVLADADFVRECEETVAFIDSPQNGILID